MLKKKKLKFENYSNTSLNITISDDGDFIEIPGSSVGGSAVYSEVEPDFVASVISTAANDHPYLVITDTGDGDTASIWSETLDKAKNYLLNNTANTTVPYVPIWAAGTYAVDAIVFESGFFWRCIVAGAQSVSFASNAAKWVKAFTPTVRQKKFTGTTGAAGETASITHLITKSKVVSVTVLVEKTNGALIPHGTGDVAGTDYFTFLLGETDIVVFTGATGTDVAARPFVAFVTYED